MVECRLQPMVNTLGVTIRAVDLAGAGKVYMKMERGAPGSFLELSEHLRDD